MSLQFENANCAVAQSDQKNATSNGSFPFPFGSLLQQIQLSAQKIMGAHSRPGWISAGSISAVWKHVLCCVVHNSCC